MNDVFVSQKEGEDYELPGPADYNKEKSFLLIHEKKFGKISSSFGSNITRFKKADNFVPPPGTYFEQKKVSESMKAKNQANFKSNTKRELFDID